MDRQASRALTLVLIAITLLHAGCLRKSSDVRPDGSKPAVPPSLTPCPLALADRDRREALRDQQSLTAAFFGDPLPGMSALDRRERERPH